MLKFRSYRNNANAGHRVATSALTTFHSDSCSTSESTSPSPNADAALGISFCRFARLRLDSFKRGGTNSFRFPQRAWGAALRMTMTSVLARRHAAPRWTRGVRAPYFKTLSLINLTDEQVYKAAVLSAQASNYTDRN